MVIGKYQNAIDGKQGFPLADSAVNTLQLYRLDPSTVDGSNAVYSNGQEQPRTQAHTALGLFMLQQLRVRVRWRRERAAVETPQPVLHLHCGSERR